MTTPSTPAPREEDALEAARSIRELLEWDWVYTTTPGGQRLHHVAEVDTVRFQTELRGTARTTCGRIVEVCVPGLMARMGMDRCTQCCDRLGISRGVGSPKNDPALRNWVETRLARTPEESHE